MKFSTAAIILASSVFAIPLVHEHNLHKRDVVTQVVHQTRVFYQKQVIYVDQNGNAFSTGTQIVGTSDQAEPTTSAAAASTSEAVVAVTTSSPVSSAPTTSVYVAPTTSTSVYVAPTTTSSSEYVAPTTSTSEYVAPTTSTSEYVAPTTSSSVYVAPTTSTSEYVAPTTSTSVYVAPTSSADVAQDVESSSSAAAVVSTSSAAVVVSTSAPSSTEAVASSTSSAASSTSTSSSGDFSGDGTYYDVGLGACGFDNVDTDYVCAVSHVLFDAVSTGNSNTNPLCGKYITAHNGDSSVVIKVVDRCVGCDEYSLDLSPSAFDQIGSEADGRISITWSWN